MGEIADGINALISLGRGDVAGAALSAASMLPIAIQLIPLLDGVGFTVYFLNVRLCEIQEKNNWNWTFNDENELKQKLELVKGKCIKENFFVWVDAKRYFIENDAITVQEALGVTVFKGEDSKLYDTRKVTYKITDMGEVKFYENQGDICVE